MSAASSLPGSEFSRSFGSVALAYDRYRPGYPSDAVDWVLSALSAPPHRLVDLGAGTGKLTRALLGRAAEVIAVEPDAAMLEVLRGAHPDADARPGSAQQIPVDDASVDAVFAGQAFHWFPRPAADLELARVIRPGGVLGLVWNVPDQSVAWVPRLYEATRDDSPDSVRIRWDPLLSPDFAPAEERRFAHQHTLPGPDGLLHLVHTWSWVSTRSATVQQRIDRDVRALIAEFTELQGDTVVFPQQTLVVRHVRL